MSEENDFGELLLAHIARAAASNLNPLSVHDVVAEKAKPSEEQRNLKPGDLVVVSYGVSGDEVDFQIAEVLDASQYAETFPDWLERLDIKSRILVNYYAHYAPQGDIGWVPRVKCMKVHDRSHWDYLYRLIVNNEEPNDLPPVWLMEMYADRQRGMAEVNNPEVDLPVPISCGECGSAAILLHDQVSQDYVFAVGHPPSSPASYEVFDLYDKDVKRTATLECQSCGHEQVVDDPHVIVANQDILH